MQGGGKDQGEAIEEIYCGIKANREYGQGEGVGR